MVVTSSKEPAWAYPRPSRGRRLHNKRVHPGRSSWWDHQVNPSCHLPFPLPCLPLAISYRRHTTIQWSEHEEFVSGIPPSAGGSLPPFSLIGFASLNMQWTPSATFSNTSKSRHYLYSNSIISTGMVQYFLYHLLNLNVFRSTVPTTGADKKSK